MRTQTTYTREQLLKFIERRNKSEFQSNLQFTIDLDACDMKAEDLGKCHKISEQKYEWDTPYGTLVESYGQMALIE